MSENSHPSRCLHDASGRLSPTLRVGVLGGFSVERAGVAQAVSCWPRRSAKTLTKLLATCPRHALHREQILEVLWPGAGTRSALNSFGKALHAARRALEPELPRRKNSTYLRLTDAMLVLDTEHVAIDADRFEQLADDALRRREISACETALAAYGGELLPEDRYADWCSERRSFLTELHVRLLLGLAEALEGRGAYDEAADRLREVLQEDPMREEVHRRLMRLYTNIGTPDQAVRQFHRCEEVLRRELDLAPQHETVSLYRGVLTNRIPGPRLAPERDREHARLQRPPAAESTLGKPFVGREGLVQYLCEQLGRSDGKKAGMVLVSGEAGVGKTRLLEEFATKAGRQGAAVLRGGNGAHATKFTCGPFAVALEGYAMTRPRAERDELAHCYPALARFVPSLGTKNHLPVPAADPRDHDLDLVQAIVRLLTDLAGKQPVLLVLGDVHDADPRSLDLLRYLVHLAPQRPWLLVGAARDEDVKPGTQLWRMIEAAMREGLCHKISLPCLSRRDCDRMVRATRPDRRFGDELLAQIYTRSRGNPLFARELVRELHECGEPATARGDSAASSWVAARVPARVRALTAMRLASMDEPLRLVLGLAAAASAAEVSLSDLRAWAAALEPPVGDTALFDALDRGLQMSLLEERGSGYGFRHPLVRSALYEGLSRHRRDQLHAALAAPSGRKPRRLV